MRDEIKIIKTRFMNRNGLKEMFGVFVNDKIKKEFDDEKDAKIYLNRLKEKIKNAHY